MKKVFFSLALIEFVCFFLTTSCTISFQNISTHGAATDLVDQNQDAKADVKPNVSIPTI